MSERFRELESPGIGRRKDIVLLATVTSFESLRHPRKSDLHQFAELFHPLFEASSDEARRQAAAALSRCPNVPPSVALQIGCAPIGIAAIFLTRALSIDDATLLEIIRTQSPAHATAIARRENLSVKLVDALVDHRQSAPPAPRRALIPQARQAIPSEQMFVPEIPLIDETRFVREEKLRNELKALVRQQPATATTTSQIAVEPVSDLNAALLVRFARLAEVYLFASTLTSVLSSSPELAERMLLDVSGHQLAVALTALEMPGDDLRFILRVFYPDLDERLGGTTRAEMLLSELTQDACRARLRQWLEADRGEQGEHQPYLAPERRPDPRVANQTSVARERPVRSERHIARR